MNFEARKGDWVTESADASVVVWITGLSGAGKTTLATELQKLIQPRLPQLVVLDGEAVRATFGHDLTHREADRVVQVKRLQGMAKMLTDQRQAVIVAVLYSHPDLLAWNRENLPGYFEVYIKASLETVIARDPKSLYAKALSGEMRDVVGLDIPWHEPVNPDMVIDGDRPLPPSVLAREVVRRIPTLRQFLAHSELEA